MSAAENTHGFTAEELDLLTPEERAALLDDEPDAAEQDALRRLAAGAKDDDDDDDGDGDQNAGPVEGGAAAPAPAPVAAPAPAPAAPAPAPAAPAPAPSAPAPAPAPGDAIAAAPAPAGDAGAAAAPAPAVVRAPVYRVELPADFEQQQAKVQNDLKDLRAKFKAGDMEIDEYEEQREAITSKGEELRELKTRAKISEDMAEQQLRHEEGNSLQVILAQAAKDGVDYKDTKVAGAFDRYWKFLAEDPDWASRPIAELHQAAHEHVLQRLGKAKAASPAPAPAAAAVPASAPTPPAPRKPPIAGLAPNLAHVPGADGPGDVAGEFADLDGLEGLDLEDGIARLSPAQREKYMAGR